MYYKKCKHKQKQQQKLIMALIFLQNVVKKLQIECSILVFLKVDLLMIIKEMVSKKCLYISQSSIRSQIRHQLKQITFLQLNFIIENYKLNMDLYLQSLNTGNRRSGPPSFPQGQRPPPRSQPPPPPHIQHLPPNSYQNQGYVPQNRPNPQVRPPPPPPIPPTGGYQGRGRPYDPGHGRQQNRQFMGNERSNPNQRHYGGRDGFANQNRGYSQEPNAHYDQSNSRGRQDHFEQRQVRQQHHFNRNQRRNQDDGSYQRRQQNYNNYQPRQHSPNYPPPPNQRQPYQQRSDFKPHYNRNRAQQQADNYQVKPRQRNYEQPDHKQRNEYVPRETFRGRGRGGDRGRSGERGRGADRGRGRGRGRQMPQRNVESKKKESVQIQSQSASQSIAEKQSVIEEQSGSQVQSQVSQEQGSNQQMQQSQQEQISGEKQQSQQMEESESYQEDEEQNNPSISNEQEPDMQRIDVMCSRQQFEERLQTFRMNNRGRQTGLRLDTGRSFAIFEINKKTNEPDIALALKRFRRSTNRAEDQNEKDQTADCPRSRKGLTLTLKHILKQIIDSDGMRARDLAFPMPPSEQKIQFLHIYDFLWNRMREMIKDVSRLQIRDRDTQEVITICQQMLRFFIIAVKQGRQPHTCKLQFDPKMNLESITKILTQLLQIYENNHYALSKEANSNAYISPNQPEITSYAILISHDLQNTLYQKLRLRVDGFGIGHSLLNCKQVIRALEIKKALKMRDYESFYKILESRQTDYIQACLLIHHLPAIRRQTLRVFQKSSEIQISTKNKKIPLSILKRNLRFSKNLNKEFKQFIDHIGVRLVQESNQTYVILNQFNESLEDHISSYAFDFPQNKKNRKFYPNSPRKANMIDASVISREELIKRSWYEGSYLDQCNVYYNREKTAPKKIPQKQQIQRSQMPSPLLQQIKQKKVVIEPKQQKQEIKEDNKNLNFLLQKKKQFTRSKFIKSLEGLIQNLVKKSDVHSQHQKKRGLQMFFQFIEVLQVGIKSKAFHRMRQFVQSQKIAFQALLNIKKLAAKRQNFISSFYKGNSEFSNFTSGFKFDGLCSKVEYAPKKHQDLLQQLEGVAAKCTTSRKQLKVLVFFNSFNQSPLTHMHIKFIKNLAKYICGEHLGNLLSQIEDLCELRTPNSKLSITRKIQKNDDESILFRICFQHYRAEQNEPIFFCGYDSIIFVDLHNDTKVFKRMMQDFIDKRTKTMRAIVGQCPKLSISICHMIVASLDRFKQKNGRLAVSQLEEYGSSISLLEQQSLKLSTIIRQNILQMMSSSIQKAQMKKQFFQAITLTNLINQIQQNLSFVQSVCKEPITLELFEKYLKANIQCIRDALKRMLQYYQLYDWKEILLQAAYLKEPEVSTKIAEIQHQIYYPEQKVDLHSMLSRKLQACNYIALLLEDTNFFDRFQTKKRERPYATNYQALAAAIEQYLQALSLQDRPESLEIICQYVAENNCNLDFTQKAILGDCKALISYIFVQLKKELKYINVILPKDFKFRIKKDALVTKPAKKTMKIQKIVQEEQEESKEVSKPLPRPKLNYKYQYLIDQLSRQLQQENEKQNLRMNPTKAIKI